LRDGLALGSRQCFEPFRKVPIRARKRLPAIHGDVTIRTTPVTSCITLMLPSTDT
jgi:hypothetical protein